MSDNLVPEVFQDIKMADFGPTFPLADHPQPTLIRHSRAGGNPSPDLASGPTLVRWIPASAGMAA
ncbi:hypothetical protein BRX37_10915 [Sphingomonas sp. S-NIH.Pt3_0716]|nr:hypothetical protein BRX37_10915 [Sphingomonas sp. S-NIH.Pt3_0716]